MSKTATVKRPNIPKSRLRGWDYINSLIRKCPVCKRRATLGNPIYSNKWQVCCMNSTCTNFNITREHENPFMAIHEWNINMGEDDAYD